MTFTEIADRVWVHRSPWFDVNVTLVGGSRGLLMIDTHASTDAAREVIDDVRRLGVGDVVAVVNTHEHVDHAYGNGAVLSAYGPVPIHAHEVATERLTASVGHEREYRGDDPRADEIRRTALVPPDRPFSSAAVLDLGDRLVELVHPGRGHTGGDAVVRVPDADVLVAGDLVEESGPPALGPDSHPLEWPLALDLVLGLLTADSVVVPGHGAVVDRDFVQDQRAELGVVAETIRDLAGRGVPMGEALDAAEWPYERVHLEHAVRRGYAHLPRAQRRLPLI